MQYFLNKRLDRKVIADAVAAEENLLLDVIGNYSAVATSPLNIISFSSEELETFNLLNDKLTFALEQDAYIINVTKTAKNFSLEYSYIRSIESTARPIDELPTGTPFELVFTVPSFESSPVIVVVSMWYAEIFDPADIDALAAIGIGLDGNGRDFIIDNVIQCKIELRKPESVTDVYVIDFPFLNQVIEV